LKRERESAGSQFVLLLHLDQQHNSIRTIERVQVKINSALEQLELTSTVALSTLHQPTPTTNTKFNEATNTNMTKMNQ
jgi:hypothetical protein